MFLLYLAYALLCTAQLNILFSQFSEQLRNGSPFRTALIFGIIWPVGFPLGNVIGTYILLKGRPWDTLRSIGILTVILASILATYTVFAI